MENSEYQRKKADDLQKRLVDANSSIHHIELVRTSILCLCLWCYEKNQVGISNLQKIEIVRFLCAYWYSFFTYLWQIEKVRLEVRQLHELDVKRAVAGPSMRVSLDIPESVGLLTPSPAPSSSRLVDLDTRRRGKRKI